MFRLCVQTEVVQDRRLAKTLLKHGVNSLTMTWLQDLGPLEEPPTWFIVAKVYENCFKPLKDIPPGVYDISWPESGEIEQVVFTDKTIFLGSDVFPIGSGIMKVPKSQLERFNLYMATADVRILAYGSDSKPSLRTYLGAQKGSQIKRELEGLPLLGQIDLDTGEIWPLPEEITVA